MARHYLSFLLINAFLLACCSIVSSNTTLSEKNMPRVFEPIVLVHGGAGDIPDSRDSGKFKGTKLATRIGYKILQDGGTSIDAVEEAVKSMEIDEMFNAGYGSVLNFDGFIQMEASIMNGADLKAGCCTLIEDILHPISVARRIMDKTRHTCLGGQGAMKFAKEQGFEVLYPPGQLITDYAREALEEFKKELELGMDVTNAKTEIGNRTKDFGEVGTVGAVAIDKDGNIAVATSTGGITGKLVGRIGDTPQLGSGTYADNLIGGVSTTGHGETILKYNVAQRILQKIENSDMDAMTATKEVLEQMTARLVQPAGAITIDHNGEIGYYFTSNKMAWAYIKGNELHYGIRKGDDFVEDVD